MEVKNRAEGKALFPYYLYEETKVIDDAEDTVF